MSKTILIQLLAFMSATSFAALPPQFSECLRENSGTTMSVYDLKDIAKVSSVTLCQNQIGLLSKYDVIELLKTSNVQAGIFLSKTPYIKEDLLEMAKAGTYVLYVDNQELDRYALIDLLKAKVLIVVSTITAGLSKEDILAIAKEGSFIINLNSNLPKEDLKQFVDAGIQVVIRTHSSGLNKESIIEVAKVNSNLVTILP